MEGVLKQIIKFGETKRMVPAEQLIMGSLIELDPFLQPDLSHDTIEQINNALISLFKINKGEFSIQCALAIAKRLLNSYKLSSNPQYFDLFNLVISQTCTSTIVACGYIVRYIGQHTKSQLPRFVEHLLKQNQSLDFAVAYALRNVFKTKSKTVEKYVIPAYNFAKKAINLPRQTTISTCIKLIKALLNYNDITPLMPLEIVHSTLKEDQFPVIKNELASLIATCGYQLIEKKDEGAKETNEWDIISTKDQKKSIFEPALNVIGQFPGIINMSLMHFLDLISPKMIAEDHTIIFNFIRLKSESNLPQLIPLLPEEVRNTYFAKISHELPTPIQLHLLTMLCPDNGSITEAAKAAVHLSCSPDKLFRRAALDFFAKFSEDQPSAALIFLQESLKFLTENTDDSENNIRGHSYIAKTILSSIKSLASAIDLCRETINILIENSLSDPKKPIFAAALYIISELPEEFGMRDNVRKATSEAVTFLTKNPLRKPLKAVIVYRGSFPDDSEGGDAVLIECALHAFPKLPVPVVLALCKIAPKSVAQTKLALEVANKVVERTISIQISTDLIKKFLRHPLPTGLDLLNLPSELTPQQIRNQGVLEMIIRRFPGLMGATRKEHHKPLFEYLSGLTASAPIAHLFILAVCQSRHCRSLPDNALSFLASQANTNNFSQAQMASECVGAYLSIRPKNVNNVLDFVERLNTIGGCFMMNAVASYVKLNTDQLHRVAIYVECKLREAKNVAFGATILSSLGNTHSMDIETSGLGLTFLNSIYNTLQTTAALQPVVIHLISKAYYFLIDTLSIDLAPPDSPLRPIVKLILESIQLTPISFAHRAYFICAKAIYTFAYGMHEIAPIRFPTYSGAASSILLAACDTFAFAAKFGAIDTNVLELVMKGFTLLQTTGDERASAFIQAVASSTDNLGFWINHIRRILLTSSLFDSQTASIEPAPAVKQCCLKISLSLLTKLSEMETLNTEYLDDLISSACKATETDLLTLQSAGFPVLQRVIELFKSRKTEEGNNLLDLYDAQFIQSVRVGFKLDLSVSGKFLYSYLSFNTENMAVDSMPAVINVYTTGLTSCKQRSSAYFSLATHLCTIARKNAKIRDEIKPFLVSLTSVFAEIVFHAMELWKDKSDWREMAQFRNANSSFFGELLSAFVWLQSISEIIIPVNALVSFLLIASRVTRERWISNAAYDALIVAIGCFGETIPDDLVALAIKTAPPSPERLRSLLLNTAQNMRPISSHDGIRGLLLSLVLERSFDIRILAHIVHTSVGEGVKEFLPAIGTQVINRLESGDVDGDHATAMFALMFKHYPQSVGQLVPLVLGLGNEHAVVKLETIGIALASFEDGSGFPLESVARFCVEMFRRGGMLLIARLLMQRPDVGIALLAHGGTKAAYIMCLNDQERVLTYLPFIELSLEAVSKCGDEAMASAYASSVLRLCAELCNRYNGDLISGHQVVARCAALIKKCGSIAGGSSGVTGAISDLEPFTITDLESVLEAHAAKAALKKRSSTLATFSSNSRNSTRAGEWQSLDMSSSDSDDDIDRVEKG